MTAKIGDVAREAGVSTATASRALNNVPTVSPYLAQEVWDAAQRLGYRPNRVARSLRRSKTETLALIIPDVEDYFCTAVARGAEDTAREAGYSLVLCNSDGKAEREEGYLRLARREHIAGVLLSPQAPEAGGSERFSREAEMPVVGIDAPVSPDFDLVTADTYSGARQATRHLLDGGWQRPACLAGPEQSPTSNARVSGFIDEVNSRCEHGQVVHTSFDRAGGQRGMQQILQSDLKPDALLIANEKQAVGALTEMRAHNVAVGLDIGVVAFDDVPWAPLLEQPLSVVAQPAYELGATSAELLIERIQDAETSIEPRYLELPTELIIRQSSLKHSS